MRLRNALLALAVTMVWIPVYGSAVPEPTEEMAGAPIAGAPTAAEAAAGAPASGPASDPVVCVDRASAFLDGEEASIAGAGVPDALPAGGCSGDLCGCYEPSCLDVCDPGDLGCLRGCRRAQIRCAIECCAPSF